MIMKKDIYIVRKIGSSKTNECALVVPIELIGKQYKRIILEDGTIQFFPVVC